MIISLSHNDLDGVGAQIALSKCYGNILPLNAAYSRVQEQLEIMEDMLHTRSNIREVYITDLNITEKEMRFVQDLANLHSHIEFNYIDHHDYTYDPTTYKTDNLKIMVSKKFCATKLTYLFLLKHKGLETDKELKHFIDVVDAYDLWQLKDPLFTEGLRMNELFWDLLPRRFFLRFKDVTKVRLADNEKIDTLFKKKDKVFKKLQESGRLFRAENKSLLLCYLDDYRSHITIDFPDFLCYVNVTLYGSASIRLSNKITEPEAKIFKDLLIDYAMTIPGVTTAGGHTHAMGMGSTLQGDNEAIVNLGRLLSVKADEIMEHTLRLYSGQGPIQR